MRTLAVVFLAVLMSVALFAVPANAQATRTWVSGVGDDANPCSRTAPCKTWAGAIAKTVAGGEIDALDPGGFGSVTITKSLTLDGGGGQVASVLTSATAGVNISAATNDVVILRNLRFDGLLGNGTGSAGTPGTNGINILAAAAVSIENCDIFGFGQAGIAVTPSSGTTLVDIRNTTVTNNGLGNTTTGAGVFIKPTGGTTTVNISNLKAGYNVTGVKVSGDGSTGTTSANITNSQAYGSQHTGFNAESTNGTVAMMLNNVVAAGNLTGAAGTGANTTVRIGSSTITQNTNGVLVQTGATVVSYKNNQINGNTTDGTPITAVGLN